MNVNLQDDWIKQVDPLLFSEDEPALLGSAQPFDWNMLAKDLQGHLKIPELSLHPKDLCWRDLKDLFEGLDEAPQKLQLTCSPLEGSAFWAMPEKDLWKLFTWVLSEKATNADIVQEELREGLYQFIAIEALGVLEKSGLLAGLSPQLLEVQPLPPGPYLCLDVGISAYQTTLWGRLCLSPDFRRAWKHFHELNSSQPFHSPLASKLELVLSVQAGEAIFSASEWKTLQLGDLLLLESGSYDPELKKGPVDLTFKGKKIYRGRMRNDHIKLTEHPFYFEELGSMDKDPPFRKHPDALPEDDDDFSSFDDDEDDLLLDDEELAAALAEELPPKEEEGEFEEAESESESEEEEEEEEHAEAEGDAQEESEVPQPQQTEAEAPEEEKKILAPNEIPFVVSVEIAHLRMTVQQLLDLGPGNQLPLGKEPDNLVDLVVNGKCIGKGELIRIGEVLGVRILQL